MARMKKQWKHFLGPGKYLAIPMCANRSIIPPYVNIELPYGAIYRITKKGRLVVKEVVTK